MKTAVHYVVVVVGSTAIYVGILAVAVLFARRLYYHTRWRNAHFCWMCKARVSYDEVMHSHARCPYCGFKHPEEATIMRTFQRAVRWSPGSWWRIWETPHEEVRDE